MTPRTPDQPLVSVVIPTYRHRDFILAAIDSVQQQGYGGAVELIVVNDGSPDDTAAVLQPLIAADKIRYVEQPNAGQAAARNRGLALATGEFLALLDDDDTWPADHLQWQVDALQAMPAAAMVFGSYQLSSESAPAAWQSALPRLLGRDDFIAACPPMSPGQALFRRAVVQQAGGLDQQLWGTDDWDLYLRLSAIGPVLFQPRIALHYRVHERNASRDFRRMYRGGRQVIEKHLPASGPDREKRRKAIAFVRQVAAQIGITQVIALRRSGHLLKMLRTLAAVIAIQPALLNPFGYRRRLQHLKQPAGH